MVKLLHVYHTGANNLYYQDVLEELKDQGKIDLTMVRLDEFVREPECMLHKDVMSYQTFPDEFHTGKFNPELVKLGDELFTQFEGDHIMVDSHDNGELDAFSRFEDPEIPRVKCFPSKWFLDNYNVVLPVSFTTKDKKTYKTDGEREIKISCKFGEASANKYHHGIRSEVRRQLEMNFPGEIYYDWSPGRDAYRDEMRRTLIAIGAPGFGQYNATYQLALRCGTLLFAHCSILDLKYLPHASLVDGQDFISYNIFNFSIKLRRLLNMPREEIDRIRRNGRIKYARGYSIKRSATQFYKYLKSLEK